MTVDDIALTMQPRLGPKTIGHLLSCMGTAHAIYNATEQELVEQCELNPQIAAAIPLRKFHKAAEREFAYMERHKITAIASTDDDYPALLRECNDYPHVIYFMGDVASLSATMLSVVGTRHMTTYGQRMCDKLIGQLSEAIPNLVIVSGLAYGVDGAAHRAALGAGLRTIAVVANRLPEISPTSHTTLSVEIVKNGGGLLSEYHSGIQPGGNGFVPRNRIIAGLSCATLVVESPYKGGSMITATLADGYNRTLMAIPGRADDMMSDGTNMLIKTNKARMVLCVEDILREMMVETTPTPPYKRIVPDSKILSKDSIGLLSLFKEGESMSHDTLLEISAMTVTQLAPLLLELEFEGLISTMPGKMFEKK